MFKGIYVKLAVSNLKKNRKSYIPYMITSILTVMMFYDIYMIAINTGIDDMPGDDSVRSVLGFGTVIVAIFACIFLSSVCMIFFSSCLPLLYLAALGYGMVYALVMISVSRGSIAAYGEEKSKRYVGIHVSINNAAGAIFAMLIGMVYDYTLSFIPILGFGAVFCLMAGGAAFALDRRDRRRS